MSKKMISIIDYEPEMSFAEIARELGISQTYVMEVYNKAMIKLINRYRGISHEKALQDEKT